MQRNIAGSIIIIGLSKYLVCSKFYRSSISISIACHVDYPDLATTTFGRQLLSWDCCVSLVSISVSDRFIWTRASSMWLSFTKKSSQSRVLIGHFGADDTSSESDWKDGRCLKTSKSIFLQGRKRLETFPFPFAWSMTNSTQVALCSCCSIWK